jgi:hypothetical protein
MLAIILSIYIINDYYQIPGNFYLIIEKWFIRNKLHNRVYYHLPENGKFNHLKVQFLKVRKTIFKKTEILFLKIKFPPPLNIQNNDPDFHIYDLFLYFNLLNLRSILKPKLNNLKYI